MAYHSTSGVASSTADLHQKLKEFLTGVSGWTLNDDQMNQTQPYFIAFSAGESGREDIYIKFQRGFAANFITVRGCMYWNPSTHTSVNPALAGDTETAIVSSDTAQHYYWFYANLDRVFIVTRLSSTYYGHYSGLIKRFWSDEIAVTQESVGSGSTVIIPVDNASIFTPGKYYIIKDNANIARVQVAAADTSSSPNTITIASLTTGYSAGAKIGEDPQPVIIGYGGPPSCVILNRHDGFKSNSHPAYARPFSNYQISNSDPDVRYGLVTMFPVFVTTESSGYEEIRGEWIDVYSIGPGGGASEDIIDLGSSTYRVFNIYGGPNMSVAVKE